MPQTNAAGLALIKSFEGCVLYAYDDLDGKYPHPPIMPGDHVIGTLTIGWGHTGSDVVPGLRWTQAQADTALARDLTPREQTVNGLISRNLTPNQFAALVSFEYNSGALAGSTLLKCVNAGDFAAAAAEFGKWVKGGTPLQTLPGLVRRRAAERALFLKP